MVKPFALLAGDAFLLANSVNESTEELVQKTTLMLHEGLVFRNPVDTGFSRSNWLVSKNAPRQDTIDVLGTFSGAHDTVSSGIAVIFTYTLGDVLWIVNNVSYMHKLNRGSSKQAPPFWIEDTILEVADRNKGVTLLSSGKRGR